MRVWSFPLPFPLPVCESLKVSIQQFLFGTEEVERDTKSLDFGQQHTRIKDNMITQLSLGTAIGHHHGWRQQ